MAPKVIKQRATGNLFADRYRVIRNGGIGREYDIKGVYTLLKSRDCPKGIEVPENVREDLSFFNAYQEEKKERWEARKKSELEKSTR